MSWSMMRLATSICPFCEAKASLKASLISPWQPTRGAATLQKRRPSRMVLSAQAGRPFIQEEARRMPARKSRNSPWGGMNVTAPPREFRNARAAMSAAERRRQSRVNSRDPKEAKVKDPMKALKMQRALANVSYATRSRTKQTLAERDDFDAFQLLPSIKQSVLSDALHGMVDVSPTPIQRLAIPTLLGRGDVKKRRRRSSSDDDNAVNPEMQQFLLAAETGSGKTLAYTLPIIDAIKRAEASQVLQDHKYTPANETAEKTRKSPGSRLFELDSPPTSEPDPSTGRPRAIILVPTAELVNQVGSLLKSLSHLVKFRTAMISAAFTGTVIRNRLFSPAGVDVVVATPHLLNSIAESDPNILSRVSHVVVDEADSLLDRSFSPITSNIIDRATPSLKQLVFCSATIPRSLDSYLRKRYPDAKRLATPNLHAIPRRVQLSVVDIEKLPYQGNRDLACAQTIWDIGKESSDSSGRLREEKLVVFVNEREKAAELALYLRSKGIDAHALSRDSDDRKQAEILAAFTGASPGKIDVKAPGHALEARASSTSTRQLANMIVLVMTDLGSRGIDTLPVRHVLLYDVPHTSIDFIHRLGRVGRMGRRGKGIVLVGRHDRKDIVREVRDGMFKGQALI